MKKLIILLCVVWGIQVIHAGEITDQKELAEVKITNYVNDPYWMNWGEKLLLCFQEMSWFRDMDLSMKDK